MDVALEEKLVCRMRLTEHLLALTLGCALCAVANESEESWGVMEGVNVAPTPHLYWIENVLEFPFQNPEVAKPPCHQAFLCINAQGLQTYVTISVHLQTNVTIYEFIVSLDLMFL